MEEKEHIVDSGIPLVSIANNHGLLTVDNYPRLSAISPVINKETSASIRVNTKLKYVNHKNERDLRDTLLLSCYSIQVPFDQRTGFSELIQYLFNLSIRWRGFVLDGARETRDFGDAYIAADSVSEWQSSNGLAADGIFGTISAARTNGIPTSFEISSYGSPFLTGTTSHVLPVKEVRINFGEFIRQACLNLYSSDDALMIGKLYDMRFKMGEMGSDIIGSLKGGQITLLENMECIIEAGKLAEDAYFELKDGLSGSVMQSISHDEYISRKVY